MYFLLSGEGPTDLGMCVNSSSTCEATEFAVGPLTLMIDHLVVNKLNFSIIEYATLEASSGNDRSPNSLKDSLAMILGVSPTRELLLDLVRSRSIDCLRIAMPSFSAFRSRLEVVIDFSS